MPKDLKQGIINMLKFKECQKISSNNIYEMVILENDAIAFKC